MKKLIVAEYNESYTGGSVVFIGSLEEFWNEYRNPANETQAELYRFQKTLYENCGNDESCGADCKWIISFEKLKEVASGLSEKAKRIVVESARRTDGWTGYDEERLRADWMINDWKLPEGLYIVFECDVETEQSGTVSDTYYCA